MHRSGPNISSFYPQTIRECQRSRGSVRCPSVLRSPSERTAAAAASSLLRLRDEKGRLRRRQVAW